MIEFLRHILRPARRRHKINGARVPEGERYYAIGDIHGRLDLFKTLIEAVDRDDRQQGKAKTTIILLGDLVDRGPDSAGVVAEARRWQQQREVRCLAGNHEEMFLQSFTDLETLRHFLKYGGRETIFSYGLERSEYNALELEELQHRIAALVPQEDREFLSGFEEMITAGDYVFVHAGIDPARPLEEQRRSDLLWIRERFLRNTEPTGHVVVHGHTIFENVEDRDIRIGIDTGAYRSGILTALVLEDDRKRYIKAVESGGAISIEQADG